MSTEKLTLEHLAPYFPYGLKFAYVKGFSEPSRVLKQIETLDITNYCLLIHAKRKPILRPLSDVSDELFKEIGFADEEDFIECVKKGYIAHNYFVKLVKHHFDVFGLIPQNLAIDINTLPQ